MDVQVINGFATTPAVTAVSYSYTGGPPETANIVEGTGVGVQPQMTLAVQTSAACDHPSVAISFSSLCDYVHDTIAGWNGMGPFGVLVNTGVSAVVAVLAGVLLAPELIPAALAVATITSFLYSLSSALHRNLFIDPSGVVVDTKRQPCVGRHRQPARPGRPRWDLCAGTSGERDDCPGHQPAETSERQQ